MIYLLSCTLNDRIPKKELIEKMDLEQLFEVCQKHILTACAAYALESAGVHDHNFTQAKEKAIRKNILLDVERRKILNRLEQEHIWYMPLKGALLKDWYPKLGMRQMSDNDILCEPGKRKQIRAIMKEFDFIHKSAKTNVDEYVKEPVYNFEMHENFFAGAAGEEKVFHEYYSDIKEKLIRDEGAAYAYHFSNEDFYLYMLAHEYKHFILGGTGVRSLADTYVFLRRYYDTLNWEYIRAELEKLDITDYECRNRELAFKVMERKKLTDEEKKLLNYYIFSGSYGTVQNHVENAFKRHSQGSKMRYMLYRIFPPREFLECAVPWAKKSKLLLPAAWIFRLLKGMISGRDKVLADLDYIAKH